MTHFPLSGLAANRPFGPREGRDELCEEIRADQQRAWAPLRFPVREVHVLARDGPDGQFRCRAVVPLGGGEAVAMQNTAYPLMPAALPPFCVDRRRARSPRPSAPPSGTERRPLVDAAAELSDLARRARALAAGWAGRGHRAGREARLGRGGA